MVLAGQESFLHYTFETRSGTVEFYSEVLLDEDIIVFKDVCIYALLDPPGIKKASITKELRDEYRALRAIGQKLGYADVGFQAFRAPGSSSASPGRIVNIRRRRKT